MDDVVLDESVLEMLRSLTVPGEPDVLREVLEIFQRDLPLRLDTVRAADAAGDVVTIERVTHSIKGSAGNIGARHLQAACRPVEEAAREKDMARVRAGLPDLEREAARVSVVIARLLE
ncbi:MAG: Hpt domain-containing protein [Acidobacteria bacterium]|nr:Hpt domain-containing protein [Acidobacteriota bacterium]